MHYTIRTECLQERNENMEFFMGFLTSSILSTIFFCIYIFLKEEVKKSKFNNIIPGQSYYVQSIGKVIIQDLNDDIVSYKDENENIYTTTCDIFLAFSKLSLKDTMPIRAFKNTKKQSRRQNSKYYNSKGKVFDVYVD